MDEKRCFCPEQRTSSKKLHFIGSAMGCFMSVLLPGPISPDICVLQHGLRGGDGTGQQRLWVGDGRLKCIRSIGYAWLQNFYLWSLFSGRITEKREPSFSCEYTLIVPPRPSTIVLQTESPKPAPCTNELIL